MKMEVNLPKFQAIMKSLAPGVGNGKLAEILAFAGFKDGQAMAYNGIFGVLHTDAIPGNFALDHMRTYSLLTTYEEETVTIETNDEKHRFLLDNNNGSKVSLAFRDIDDFPFFSMKEVVWNENIDPNLIPALQIAMTTAANDQTGGVYWGIFFGKRERDGKEIKYILAADGAHRATYLEVDTPITNVIVPKPFIEKIVAEGTPDAIAYDGRFVYVRYGAIIYFSNTLGAMYPDLSRLFKIECEAYPIDAKLRTFAKRCAILGCGTVQYIGSQKMLQAQTTLNDFISEKVELNQDDFKVQTTYLIEVMAFAKSMRCSKDVGQFMVFYFEIPGIQTCSLQRSGND
jgi:DNA polymerase III sliding clamp (beta) subunit (PCNA family)